MSQAEELLNSLSENEIEPLLSDPETEPHIVIGDDRIIVVPDELKRIAVQYDHDVETVTFDCPRYWDEHDMSQMGIYINYIRKDMIKGMYRAENVVVDADNDRIMHFDWTISRNVSQIKGGIKFLVCVKKMDDEGYEQNHWNSELNEEMYVSEGLECEESVFEPYPDIVSQWAADVEEVKRILLDARDSGELDGFSPNVTIVNLEDGSGYRVVITDRYGANTFEVKHGSAATATAVELEDGSGYRIVLTDAVDGAQIIELKHGSAATATAIDIEGGHRLVLTDAVDGQQVVDIMDGVDGFSPNVTVVPIDGGNRLVLTDKSGANIINIMNGVDGEDAVSPTITQEAIEGGYRITVDGINGTSSFDLMHGKDGTDGDDAISPTVESVAIEGGYRVTITDVNGTRSIDLLHGTDGTDAISPTITVTETEERRVVDITDVNGSKSYEILNGEDGVSPVVTVETITGGHRVTITDVNGTQIFDVMDGSSDSIGEYVNSATATDEEIDTMLTEAFSAVNV